MKNKNDKNGSVLLYAVVIFGIVALTTVIALSALSSNSIVCSGECLNSKQARFLADTCAMEALQNIRDDEAFAGNGNLSIESGLCNYTVINLGGENRRITALGTVNNIVRKVKVEIDGINPQIKISFWQEVGAF